MQNLIKATKNLSAKNCAASKVHLVVWMASHCETPSLRETYVCQIGKFLLVDFHGGCGNFSCIRNDSHYSLSDPKCMIEAKYKFNSSFENSICDDYVTEKFFEIMNHDIVPVVYNVSKIVRLSTVKTFYSITFYSTKF
jgi:alpha-1,3-fucosyltransferase